MGRINIGLLAAVGCLTATGCGDRTEPQIAEVEQGKTEVSKRDTAFAPADIDWEFAVWICWVDGREAWQVYELLNESGISVRAGDPHLGMEGIGVLEEDVDRAFEIVKEDSSEKGYAVVMHESVLQAYGDSSH